MGLLRSTRRPSASIAFFEALLGCLAFLAVFLTPAAASAASPETLTAPCAPGPTTLCLNAQRFRLDVQWKDFQGNTGAGQAVALTSDTGYFWFFSSSNVELVVKVLDGRAINGKFWVFYGALSDVQYTITITDTVTHARRTYVNPQGHMASAADTSAF